MSANQWDVLEHETRAYDCEGAKMAASAINTRAELVKKKERLLTERLISDCEFNKFTVGKLASFSDTQRRWTQVACVGE